MAIHVSDPDKHGAISIKEDRNGIPHRRVIVPGYIQDGVWFDTDLTGEPQEVVTKANAAWTQKVKQAYEAFVRKTLPPGFTPEQVAAATNKVALETNLRDARTGNKEYIDRTSPSAAQNAAQIKSLSKQMNDMIRLLLQQFDATT